MYELIAALLTDCQIFEQLKLFEVIYGSVCHLCTFYLHLTCFEHCTAVLLIRVCY